MEDEAENPESTASQVKGAMEGREAQTTLGTIFIFFLTIGPRLIARATLITLRDTPIRVEFMGPVVGQVEKVLQCFNQGEMD
jgi:hypothetical protein